MGGKQKLPVHRFSAVLAKKFNSRGGAIQAHCAKKSEGKAFPSDQRFRRLSGALTLALYVMRLVPRKAFRVDRHLHPFAPRLPTEFRPSEDLRHKP